MNKNDYPEKIEVKYAFELKDAEAADKQLSQFVRDDAPAEARDVYFFDRKVGDGFAYFDQGIIVRARSGAKKAQLTLKVRGPEARAVRGRFSEDGPEDGIETKFEGDVNAGKEDEKGRESFSLTAEVPVARLDELLDRKEALSGLFPKRVIALFPKLFEDRELEVFGPIETVATKLSLGKDEKVERELWTLGPATKLLEVSDKKKPDEAQAFGERLIARFTKEWKFTQLAESKTKVALTKVASRRL
jgi:hypothetical protein